MAKKQKKLIPKSEILTLSRKARGLSTRKLTSARDAVMDSFLGLFVQLKEGKITRSDPDLQKFAREFREDVLPSIRHDALRQTRLATLLVEKEVHNQYLQDFYGRLIETLMCVGLMLLLLGLGEFQCVSL